MGARPGFQGQDESKLSMPGEPLGYLRTSHYLNKEHGWALVHLDSANVMQNMIQVPNGFGEAFVLSEFAKDMLDCQVQVVTGSKKVIIGQGLPGIHDKKINGQGMGVWKVQLVTGNLGKHIDLFVHFAFS